MEIRRDAPGLFNDTSDEGVPDGAGSETSRED